ncbi:MAG: hypothetical protein EKK29_01355 [Hyphomicrobiales bacterium]|nr:MAG: hypothetical protein EKK29_01355 [Hyphomicrobiales bacterium]
MRSDTDDEGKHRKDVFAHLGVAVYKANVFELGLINAIYFAGFVEPRRKGAETREDYEIQAERFLEKLYDKTLGQLLNCFFQYYEVDAALKAQLIEAKIHRNYVAHGFVREKAELFPVKAGRDQLIEKLLQATELFDAADKAVDRLVFQRSGTSEEKLNDALGAHLKKIERSS